MKVVFLDIDGVLCTPLSMALCRLLRVEMQRQMFDPIALFWLRRLCRKTGCRVVLSSSWRAALYDDDPLIQAICRNMYARLAKNGTPIVDVTPLLPQGDRADEIHAWLAGAQPVQAYAILDDNDRFASRAQVRAHWVRVANGAGLRRSAYRQALRLLQAQ